jgi:hypothetical protein
MSKRTFKVSKYRVVSPTAHTATVGLGGSSREELKMLIFQNIGIQNKRLLDVEEGMHAVRRRIMKEKWIKTVASASKLEHIKYLKTIRGFESKREKAVRILADLLDLLNDIEATPGNTKSQIAKIKRLDAILNSPEAG